MVLLGRANVAFLKEGCNQLEFLLFFFNFQKLLCKITHNI